MKELVIAGLAVLGIFRPRGLLDQRMDEAYPEEAPTRPLQCSYKYWLIVTAISTEVYVCGNAAFDVCGGCL